MSPTCPTHPTRQEPRFRKGVQGPPSRSGIGSNTSEGPEQGLRLTFAARLGSVRRKEAKPTIPHGAGVRRAGLPASGLLIRLGTAGLPQSRRYLAEDAGTNGTAGDLRTGSGRARPRQP